MKSSPGYEVLVMIDRVSVLIQGLCRCFFKGTEGLLSWTRLDKEDLTS